MTIKFLMESTDIWLFVFLFQINCYGRMSRSVNILLQLFVTLDLTISHVGGKYVVDKHRNSRYQFSFILMFNPVFIFANSKIYFKYFRKVRPVLRTLYHVQNTVHRGFWGSLFPFILCTWLYQSNCLYHNRTHSNIKFLIFIYLFSINIISILF